MHLALYLVFFLSGASALLFETLWFRLAGLTFGNSVWASSLVLASFMGGLAVGNVVAARYGDAVKDPVRLYALVEVLIALTGTGLVLLLPELTRWMTPVFSPLVGTPMLLDGVRLLSAFCLMLVPASAMGATLPLLVGTLHGESSGFGEILGRLYGFNTLGAVVGAILGDALLISWLGVLGTGFFAASLNCIAAGVALSLGILAVRPPPAPAATPERFLTPRALRFLLAAFVSGGILLSLEVVWFRFFVLYFDPRNLVFSLMLAVVLAGIGVGGLLASALLKSFPTIHGYLPAIALISGACVAVLYGAFPVFHASVEEWGLIAQLLASFAFLMFPVSLLSGVLFTFVGEAAYEDLKSNAGTTGALVMLNTLGAMFGSLLAGFVLIPRLGMEGSFFLLGVAYLAVAAFTFERSRALATRAGRVTHAAAFAIFGLSAAFFPFGTMYDVILPASRAPMMERVGDMELVEVREGVTETIQYLRKDYLGSPLQYRLMTNRHSMSGTDLFARRYMKLFVYLPIAVHPEMDNALLISFGVGSTAKALTDSPEIAHIDIVDISKDVVELSRVVYPEVADNPIHDPRVDVHIEDGRYFLQTTAKRFDLITAEPPPLKHSLVVNLYTQEFFQLIEDRLAPGGIVTYWLPVYQLTAEETNSVLKGFCNVFDDCSLWRGAGYELIMWGTRGLDQPVTGEEFARQWDDPVVRQELVALGLEQPELFANLLIADTVQLRERTLDTLPLTDNYPDRMSVDPLKNPAPGEYEVWSQHYTSPVDSETITRLWPADLALASAPYQAYNEIFFKTFVPPGNIEFPYTDLHTILTQTTLQVPVLLLLRSSPDLQRNVDLATPTDATERATRAYHLAVRAVAERDFALAEARFKGLHGEELFRTAKVIYYYRIYLLLVAGETERARELAHAFLAATGGATELEQNARYWRFLESRFPQARLSSPSR